MSLYSSDETIKTRKICKNEEGAGCQEWKCRNFNTSYCEECIAIIYWRHTLDPSGEIQLRFRKRPSNFKK